MEAAHPDFPRAGPLVDGRGPAGWPTDQVAVQLVAEWAGSDAAALSAPGIDLRGGDFRGADLSGASLVGAMMSHVGLAGTEFYRADLEGADLEGSDLTDASLVKANMDGAGLRSARLDRADLAGASLYGVDATGASFRDAQILGASLLGTDLRGADLSGAVLRENSFKVQVDESTLVRGLSGSVFGPVTLWNGAESSELGGEALDRWIAERGGQVTVLQPRTR
ncbi:hypothetical protein ASE03_20765 [Kitasatospora sp. Root187]|nr:hypothetical protein ASC99_34320 [Kitasatospora sp. Root107]KRB73775.1 hypothetical protein ASE03_20765 [Kitasatospora sp. Root187]